MPSTHTLEPISPVGSAVEIRSRRTIQLRPVRIRILSNEPELKVFRFFSECSDLQRYDSSDVESDITLSLRNISLDLPRSLKEQVLQQRTREPGACFTGIKRMSM
jgi:hypothetical protein